MSDKTEFPRFGIPEDKVPDETGLEVKDEIVEDAEPYKDGGGWTITCKSGTGFGLSIPEGADIEPPVEGDRIRLWTVQWSMITGLALRGTVIRFQTHEEHYAEREREREEKDEAERKAYAEGGREQLEARIATLPLDFRRRVFKYMDNDEDWGWRHGPYEVFCCEQAALYGERAKEVVAIAKGEVEVEGGEPSLLEALNYWDEKIESGAAEEKPPTMELVWLTWWNALGSVEFAEREVRGKDASEYRKELMPGHSDQHSGNTYEVAYHLALIWLRPEPESESGGAGVFKLHGALAALNGSEAYGDPMSDEELAQRWERAREKVAA